MAFRSHLSPESKAERALVLLLALAILLVRGGERIGSLGSSRGARSDRQSVPRIAEALVNPSLTDEAEPTLPRDAEVRRFSSLVLFSDFLEPIESVHARLAPFADREVRGHIVQILDPAEETFPFTGRLEFRDVLGPDRLVIGRAERLREEYRETLASHRRELQRLAQRLGWSFTLHHTDAVPTSALLALFSILSGEVGAAPTTDYAAAEAF